MHHSPRDSTLRRLLTAGRDFAEAESKAAQVGIKLERISSSHYRLTHTDGWIANIYPGTCFVQEEGKAPGLTLPEDWRLLDVVVAAALQEALKCGGL